MTIERALIGTTDAAAAASVYVEDVFSTYLYTGTGASQTINNGIDLATKGGMVWIKGRQATGQLSPVVHALYDTARGPNNRLNTASTNSQWVDYNNELTSFLNNGFSLGAGGLYTNDTTVPHVSWTFRKQPKFFDVVTYTGNGTTQNIAHSLGVAPGMIIVKSSSIANDWTVWHRSLTSGYKLALNSTGAANNTVQNNYFGNNSAVVAPTSTQFTIGSNYNLNQSGATYVAYLFADSNSGGFGANGTDSVVACGSFTTDGSGAATVSLDWEPQFAIMKSSSAAGTWIINDIMRGADATGTTAPALFAETSAAESTNARSMHPNATGFVGRGVASTTYIYLAISRGPMKTPTNATKVFAPITSSAASGTSLTTSFPVDFQIAMARTSGVNGTAIDRLRGVSSTSTASRYYLTTNSTDAEYTSIGNIVSLGWDNLGFKIASDFANASTAYWNFRRAPGFMDCVCYTGTGSATTVAHNLGVAPELMIVKRRDGIYGWITYSAALGNTKHLSLQGDAAPITGTMWNNTSPTNSVFSIGTSISVSSGTYVAYLFATCPGVSKVGSYTGNGSSQTIDCGFTAGARFVLIKRTDSTGDWYVWDTARGISAGNDPHLSLNTSVAEVTTNDTIDPASSGFIVNQVAATNVNVTSATYIYLAIA